MTWQHITVDRFKREVTIEHILAEFHGGDSTGFEVYISGSFDDPSLSLYLSAKAATRLEGTLRDTATPVGKLPDRCRLFVGDAPMRHRLYVVR